MKTPIVLIAFNRPDLTRKVFDRIAAARPASLYLIADGPRNNAEAERCAEVRAIMTRVDWPCDITTDFVAHNLGCRGRVISGLNAVFKTTDRAIILEDDCLPHPKFFEFCETLLERFKDTDRVLEIGGANYQRPEHQTEQGFYFSRYVHNHGWATWRRAWKLLDADIKAWPSLRNSGFLSTFCGRMDAFYLTEILDRIHAGKLTTSWDYQWQLALWLHEGLSVVPNTNLISNIGYGAGATHTRWQGDPMGGLPVSDLLAIGESPPLFPDTRFDSLEVARGAPSRRKMALRMLGVRLLRHLRHSLKEVA